MKNSALRKMVCTFCAAVIAVSSAACGAIGDDSSAADKPANKREQPKLSAASLTGGKDYSIGDSQLEAVDANYVSAQENFAFELLKSSALEDISSGGNALVSPMSVMAALGMTANGAEGDTLAEMQNVIGGGMDMSAFNENSYFLQNSCEKDADVNFNCANSIWLREGTYTMKEDFLKNISAYYEAELFSAPFDQTTLSDINNWVKTNTNEMIPSILDRISDDAVLYLVNAIAFEGEWAAEYLDTQIREDSVFTNSEGSDESCTMLSSCEGVYLEGDNEKGFVKNYKGGKFAFMALLPDEGISLDDYISSLTAEEYAQLYSGKSYEDVYTLIPEFKSEYDVELSESLIGMGMESAFTGAADFSGFTEEDNGFSISMVLHKTFIELDRNGTKAAAATIVEVEENCAVVEFTEPKYVYLDRPFVYAIIDTETGMPLFLGAVNTVK